MRTLPTPPSKQSLMLIAKSAENLYCPVCRLEFLENMQQDAKNDCSTTESGCPVRLFIGHVAGLGDGLSSTTS